MRHLQRLYIFVEVAKHESFTVAANHLGLSSAAVSKQIQNLEQDLQIKLFNRTTRIVSLTEEGGLLYRRVSHVFDSLGDVFEELGDLKLEPKGTLRITLPVSLGIHYLKKPIAEFARLYPEVNLKIQFEDRQINLAEEEYDIALRIASLKDSNMIARKLASVPVCLFAAANYEAENKIINVPNDLLDCNVFEYTRSVDGNTWSYIAPDGVKGTVHLQSQFSCDSVEMMKEAALKGVGIFISPTIFVRKELQSGELVQVLSAYKTSPERNLYALFPHNRYLSSRMRLFIDYIAQFCYQEFR